jgi:hypothetical protein
MDLLHLKINAKSLDGREFSLLKIITETLKFISFKAI